MDVNDFGVILKDNSIDAIKTSVKELASLPSDELKERTKKSWEYANKNHTRKQFTQAYTKFVEKLIT